MSFYTDLRDNTAGPLIAQFGQAATYRVHGAETYDNASGKTTRGTASDTQIRVVELPMGDIGSTRGQKFSEEVVAQATAVLLASAKEFAAAKVVPKVDAQVILSGKTYRILEIKTLAPASTAVIYTMAVV